MTKISGLVEGLYVSRVCKNRCNRGPKLSATGAQTHDHSEYSIGHNSKPEVEIDFGPTAFITVWPGLKSVRSSFR